MNIHGVKIPMIVKKLIQSIMMMEFTPQF